MSTLADLFNSDRYLTAELGYSRRKNASFALPRSHILADDRDISDAGRKSATQIEDAINSGEYNRRRNSSFFLRSHFFAKDRDRRNGGIRLSSPDVFSPSDYSSNYNRPRNASSVISRNRMSLSDDEISDSGTESWRNLTPREFLMEDVFNSGNYLSNYNRRRNASSVLPRRQISINDDEINGVKSWGISPVSAMEDVFNPGNYTRRRNTSLVVPRNQLPLNDHEITDRRTTSWRISDPPTYPESKINNWDEKNKPEKKGIWKWKPIRALTHLTMQKLSCLFAVDVISVHSLPPSMNGTRLVVNVKKKESKDYSVQTTPARVTDGAADFEETLFIKSHVYFVPGCGFHVKFEPRLFQINLLAVDSPEVNFCSGFVNLSALIEESILKSFEGIRINKWDKRFDLNGKANGGELVLKLGFQFMGKNGGFQIYRESTAAGRRLRGKQSVPWLSSHKLEEIAEENEHPEFSIVEKGVEIDEKSSDKGSASSEIVKEVVGDQISELNAIAMKIIASKKESLDDEDNSESPTLDSDEDKVTKIFLKLLEDDGLKKKEDKGIELDVVPDLGKGLGCVVQIKNGGFLVGMNHGKKKDSNLAMQISKPVVIGSENGSGFEVFRRMAELGVEGFTSEVMKLMPIEEIRGKSAERIAFEGIASAIISGRNKEGASSTAARAIATVKSMTNAMNDSRKSRDFSGKTLKDYEILPFSMEKIESMAIEGMKIQAETSQTEAPVARHPDTIGEYRPLTVTPFEDWVKENNFPKGFTIAVVIQIRDPIREFEAVGGPMIAVIEATSAGGYEEDEEKKYKVVSIELGGLKLRTKSSWDGENEKLTALQWLIGNGLANIGNKGKRRPAKTDVLWSMAARVVGNAWLKPSRDGDVIFTH